MSTVFQVFAVLELLSIQLDTTWPHQLEELLSNIPAWATEPLEIMEATTTKQSSSVNRIMGLPALRLFAGVLVFLMMFSLLAKLIRQGRKEGIPLTPLLPASDAIATGANARAAPTPSTALCIRIPFAFAPKASKIVFLIFIAISPFLLSIGVRAFRQIKRAAKG